MAAYSVGVETVKPVNQSTSSIVDPYVLQAPKNSLFGQPDAEFGSKGTERAYCGKLKRWDHCHEV